MANTAKFYAGIGSRTTPNEICAMMTSIAQRLAVKGYILRSGHASGADLAFERGAMCNDQIFVPWPRFNNTTSQLLPTAAAFKMAEEYHPAWHHLNRGSKALMARNCHQILGHDLMTPVEFVVCWTHDGSATGGTGQALRIAEAYKIPIYNLYHQGVRNYWNIALPDEDRDGDSIAH